MGFSYSKNMANFEAFHRNISSSINLLFLKSDLAICQEGGGTEMPSVNLGRRQTNHWYDHLQLLSDFDLQWLTEKFPHNIYD